MDDARTIWKSLTKHQRDVLKRRARFGRLRYTFRAPTCRQLVGLGLMHEIVTMDDVTHWDLTDLGVAVLASRPAAGRGSSDGRS